MLNIVPELLLLLGKMNLIIVLREIHTQPWEIAVVSV
jgi:hypothetical protein